MSSPADTLTVLVMPAGLDPVAEERTIPWAAHTQPDNLSQIQGIVGGYVEAVTLASGALLLVNEDGANSGLPLNMAATRLLVASEQTQGVYAGVRPIVGSALLVGGHDVNGDTDGEMHSLTPQQMQQWCAAAGIRITTTG